MKLVIVDYGAGNLRSVARAVTHVGGEPLISSSGLDVEQAEALIVPGVGGRRYDAQPEAARPGRPHS